MSTCRSACPYDCPEGCSLLVETEGNTVTSITGDPANPFTDGWVCAKMRNLPEAINSPERILTPLRRTGAKGTGEFEPISWDQAIGEITSRWKDLIAQYGAETILPYSYAGTMGVVHRNCGEGFFHALGASRLKRTLCSTAKSTGWQKVMGGSCDLAPWDVEHSDLILLWSTNIPATRAHLAPILRKAKANGAKIILIDVYENASAELADQTILIQPGSDGALALSMLQVLDQEGLTDEAWLAEHAAGWEEFRATLDVWDPEETQCLIGQAPDVIRDLARAYGRAKAPCIVLGSGFSRSGNGGEATGPLPPCPPLWAPGPRRAAAPMACAPPRSGGQVHRQASRPGRAEHPDDQHQPARPGPGGQGTLHPHPQPVRLPRQPGHSDLRPERRPPGPGPGGPVYRGP